MPYVDPSRVQMALRFAELAGRPPAERAAATEDLKVFLAALWADATPAARTRYATAAGRDGGPLPWAAVMLPAAPSQTDPLRGPAVVELLVGHADPDDEGVPGYRLVLGQPRADAVVDALYGWDTWVLRTAADPAGWRLGGGEDTPTDATDEDVGDVGESPAPPADEPPEEAEVVEEATPVESLEEDGSGVWKVGAVAAGFALVGFAAWRWG